MKEPGNVSIVISIMFAVGNRVTLLSLGFMYEKQQKSKGKLKRVYSCLYFICFS